MSRQSEPLGLCCDTVAAQSYGCLTGLPAACSCWASRDSPHWVTFDVVQSQQHGCIKQLLSCWMPSIRLRSCLMYPCSDCTTWAVAGPAAAAECHCSKQLYCCTAYHYPQGTCGEAGSSSAGATGLKLGRIMVLSCQWQWHRMACIGGVILIGWHCVYTGLKQ